MGAQEVIDAIPALLLGMARLGAMLAMLPFHSKQASSVLLRAGIAMVFTLPVLPMLVAGLQGGGDSAAFFGLLAKEVFIGACLGWIAALPFWGAEAVGFIISNQYGATAGTSTNALSGNETSPLGTLLLMAYLVVFLGQGGMQLLVKAFYVSYDVWPVSAVWPRLEAGGGLLWLGMFDTLMRLAVVVAAPAMIAMLLAEIGLALVTLFAPQLPVFFLGMSIKALVALFVLVIYLGTLLGHIADYAAWMQPVARLRGAFQ